jgi:hypothetical protein
VTVSPSLRSSDPIMAPTQRALGLSSTVPKLKMAGGIVKPFPLSLNLMVTLWLKSQGTSPMQISFDNPPLHISLTMIEPISAIRRTGDVIIEATSSDVASKYETSACVYYHIFLPDNIHLIEGDIVRFHHPIARVSFLQHIMFSIEPKDVSANPYFSYDIYMGKILV